MLTTPKGHPSVLSLSFLLLDHFPPLAYASKTAFGTLPTLSDSENMPMLEWIWKLLELLLGCETGVLLTAHAKVLMSVVLSPPPFHLLQPVQATSTVQCVVLRDAPMVRYVAEE
jgi:hypothetical protein